MKRVWRIFNRTTGEIYESKSLACALANALYDTYVDNHFVGLPDDTFSCKTALVAD